LREPSAISNSYSIQDDYKRVDPATRKAIAVVNERMACLDEADAGRVSEKESWKAYVEDKFMSYFSAGDARRRAVMGLLDAASQAGGRAAALAVLRAHAAPDPEKPTRPRNVCNHDRDVVGSPTTGSMLVEYAPGGRTVLWFTGASYACSNVFKPILLEDGRFKPLWVDYDYAEGTVAGGEYWSTRRGKARRVQKNFKAADAFASKLAEIQTRVFDVVDALAPSASPGEFAKSAERVGAIVAEWDARTI
jgi:hypothetical protein